MPFFTAAQTSPSCHFHLHQQTTNHEATDHDVMRKLLTSTKSNDTSTQKPMVSRYSHSQLQRNCVKQRQRTRFWNNWTETLGSCSESAQYHITNAADSQHGGDRHQTTQTFAVLRSKHTEINHVSTHQIQNVCHMHQNNSGTSLGEKTWVIYTWGMTDLLVWEIQKKWIRHSAVSQGFLIQSGKS